MLWCAVRWSCARLRACARALSSRVAIKEAIAANTRGKDVFILGWVKSVRKQKELVFIDVSDGSTPARLQVVVPSQLLSGVSLTMGCSVMAEGRVVESAHTGQKVEMTASHLQLLGACNPKEYPFKHGKVHGLEYIRQFPHLRAQTGVFSRVLRLRNAVTMAVHRFFQEKGYVHVHTPVLTSSDCEGAGELFQIRPAESTEKDKEFFSTSTYLTVSGQLHAEAIASGMSSVYTFGPTFRAEKSHTKRHLSEFYMVEAETVLRQPDLSELLEVVEELYKHTLQSLLQDNAEDIHYFHNEMCSEETKTSILRSIEKPFTRMTYTEAIAMLEKSARKEEFQTQPKWGSDLQRDHELYLLSVCGQLPVFITNFPTAIKPFYARQLDSNRELVSSVDLLVPGVGEVMGGSVREEREDTMRDTLLRLGLLEKYQWYLDLRRFGTVPHGGFGIGFERLLQAFLGIADIRDVTPFPRYLGSCQM